MVPHHSASPKLFCASDRQVTNSRIKGHTPAPSPGALKISHQLGGRTFGPNQLMCSNPKHYAAPLHCRDMRVATVKPITHDTTASRNYVPVYSPTLRSSLNSGVAIITCQLVTSLPSTFPLPPAEHVLNIKSSTSTLLRIILFSTACLDLVI